MQVVSRERLKQQAEEMGLALYDTQVEQLAHYGELLLKWNATYNLTSITNADDVLTLHLLDSLTLVHAFDEAVPNVKTVMDVGSGGGLPAIPLATVRPDISVTMVDTVKKKVLFLRQAVLELRLLNAKALHTRVEKLKQEPVDVITSRAFASLRDMTEWTRHLLKPEGRWLAMKGKLPQEEIDALSSDIEVEKIVPLSVPGGDFERNLIVLKFKGMS